jgi:catechol 2,3-dioxygenase-like lactoylglutathione lyase family enzyme
VAKIGVIDSVAITVSDIERSIEWYSRNFGLEVYMRDKFTAYKDGFFGETPYAPSLYQVPEGTTCSIAILNNPDGGAAVEIFQFTPQKDAERVPWDRVGITHFGFTTNNFTELYNKLVANGVDFCMEPSVREFDQFKWAFMRDPDGNLVELGGYDPKE